MGSISQYVTREYPVNTRGIYYDKDWAMIEIKSYISKDTEYYFTDKATMSTGAETIDWKAWTGYCSLNMDVESSFEVMYSYDAPEDGEYQIENMYVSQQRGYSIEGDVYVDGEIVSPVCAWGTHSQFPKRHYDMVKLTKGTHSIRIKFSGTAIWLGAIIRHVKWYTADLDNTGNLTILSANYKKAEQVNVDEFNFKLLYDHSFTDTSPVTDEFHNPSGLILEYRDEVNFYIKTNTGNIKRIFGGYIHSITPDREKMEVNVTCASRLTDMDKKYCLVEMALMGGDEDYKGKYVTGDTLIDVMTYTRAIEETVNMVQETLQSNLPSGSLQLPGTTWEDGFRQQFTKQDRNVSTDKKKYSMDGMIGKWMDEGIFLRNEPTENTYEHMTFWDSAYYPDLEKNGLEITEYPVFYVGYEMLEAKWEEGGKNKLKRDTSICKEVQAAADTATSSTKPAQIVTDCAVWVHNNVGYLDYSGFQKNTKTVLSTRKANCCDGSRLVAEMCAYLGVTIEYCHSHKGGDGHVWNRYDGVYYDWCRMKTAANIGNYVDKWGDAYQFSTYPKTPF